MTTAKNNGNFKRHFPRIGKCVCCCCLSPETSVKVCTYIFLCFMLLGLVGIVPALQMANNLSLNIIDTILNYGSIVINVLVVISLILLLIGISKVKFSFLNQFKIIYLIYIIFQLCSSVYASIMLFNDEYIKLQVKAVKDQYSKMSAQYAQLSQISDEQIAQSIKQGAYTTIIGYAIGIAIIVYYYLTTCSYIEDIQEDAMEEAEVRNSEENQY